MELEKSSLFYKIISRTVSVIIDSVTFIIMLIFIASIIAVILSSEGLELM